MKQPVYRIIFVFIAVIILSLLYFFYPAANHFYPKCIFHGLTGLYCPGCGSQRSVSALLHGNILQAISYNVLLVASLPLILYSAFAFLWNSFNENKIKQSLFYSPVFIKCVFITVVLFGILRNIRVAPFTLLAP
jgi:uncharacterized protein DUF2752